MSFQEAISLLTHGPSRPTLYKVEMPSRYGFNTSLADSPSSDSVTMNDYLSFFCKTITIPEARLDTVIALGQENMGIARETPQNFIYGKPLTMTVIENTEFEVYKMMREWMDKTTVNSNQFRGNRSQRMNYYQTYIGDFKITKLEQPDDQSVDNQYKEPVAYNFIAAYPIRIGGLNLSSEETNTALSFEIAFTYESYYVEGLENSLRI